MAVRINSINLEGNDRFTKINLPMSPVLNCRPATPPSDQESCHKSINSDVSNNSPPGMISNGMESASAENSLCCDPGNQDEAPAKPQTPTNNNNIPLNYKKIPSPSETQSESQFRSSWNSSPILKSDRDQSISPPSSNHRRNSVSSLSPERNPSRASSETHPSESRSPDNYSRSPKLSHDLPQPVEVPQFHDNRISPDSFKLNTFIPDPMNPYIRSINPLNPFQPTHNFLSNPFLASSDPKLLLNHPSFGLMHTVHQLNGLNKLHPQDLKDFPGMTIQQLQFLQNRLQQSLPVQHGCPQLPFTKFQEKSQLSLLMQARKNSKSENDSENVKKEMSFRPIATKLNGQDRLKFPDPKLKDKESGKRRASNDDPDDSDSDELLSVGSESPPPNCQVTLFRRDTDNESDAGSSSLDCSFKTNFQNSNRTNIFEKSKKFQNGITNRLQNSKSVNANNRTLKFSIDNILKSDFGGNDSVIPVKKPKSDCKKEKPVKEIVNERTSGPVDKEVKKSDGEKESPVDLSQDNSANGSGSDTPMLWPAWVYCTRYSDRPSSGPRTRRSKNKEKNPEEKRPRTAFSGDQLSRLKHEFAENRYLTERRRQDLARELGLNEAQIKIWFQNKRAKMKKARGEKNPLALQLMAQGLYNHSTVPLTREEEEAAAAELSD